jgi:hypothetical protein
MYASGRKELMNRLSHFELNPKVKEILSVKPEGFTKEGFIRYEITYKSTSHE